jgi:hypothetical protein
MKLQISEKKCTIKNDNRNEILILPAKSYYFTTQKEYICDSFCIFVRNLVKKK